MQDQLRNADKCTCSVGIATANAPSETTSSDVSSSSSTSMACSAWGGRGERDGGSTLNRHFSERELRKTLSCKTPLCSCPPLMWDRLGTDRVHGTGSETHAAALGYLLASLGAGVLGQSDLLLGVDNRLLALGKW